MEFFQAFGVSWQTIPPSIVNFVVLMFLLSLLGYKPILAFVKKRQKMIEDGIANAAQAQTALEGATLASAEMLAKTKKEAALIIEEARKKASLQEQAILDKAKLEVAQVVKQGKDLIAVEKQKMLTEVKAEVIEMVIASTKKVLGGAVTQPVDEQWLKQQLGQTKK